MPAAADSPRVHIPPPFFYVAAIGGGAVLQRLAPLPIGGGPWRLVAALVLIAAFGALLTASFTSFWTRRTTVIPNRPATALVIAGPYRFTRNPMYVALALLTAGTGLWLNSWWVLVLLAPAIVAIDRVIIAREEAYLRRRFGADYDAYVRRVRRWL